MAKYKICPVCGKHNMPTMLECIGCETDLSGIRTIDEDIEKAQSVPSPSVPKASSVKMIRLCDCGYKNSVQNRKCISCGEDISMVVPTPDTAEKDEPVKFVLSSIDGSFAYELTQAKTVVGRENEMREYLDGKPYVSRKHAEFQVEKDKLFLVNYSHTNYTFINNQKIDDENPHELSDGDEVGLGGNSENKQRQSDAAYFLVRIGSCS